MEFLKRVIHQSAVMLPESHASSLVELKNGTLLCAWCAGTSESAQNTAIYGAVLAPSDAEWRPRPIFVNTPNFSDGNPVLLLDAQERLWLFYVTMLGDRWDTCQVKYAHSLDGGQTWTAPHILRMDWGWMTGGKPLLCPNKALLLPLYEEKGTVFVLRSEDGGIHWQSSNVLGTEQSVIQPTIVPLSDGRLLMYLRAQEPSHGTLWQSVSADEGRTWSSPTRAALPDPKARMDLTLLASGRLALAFHHTSERRTALTLALSEDDGQTWPYHLEVERELGEASNPALIQARDDRIHLMYKRQRTYIAHHMCDEEYLLANARRVS